jgi:hypothetical protein
MRNTCPRLCCWRTCQTRISSHCPFGFSVFDCHSGEHTEVIARIVQVRLPLGAAERERLGERSAHGSDATWDLIAGVKEIRYPVRLDQRSGQSLDVADG